MLSVMDINTPATLTKKLYVGSVIGSDTPRAAADYSAVFEVDFDMYMYIYFTFFGLNINLNKKLFSSFSLLRCPFH